MSNVKPVFNIVTGYVNCRDLLTGEIFYATEQNIKYDEKGDPFVELAVTGPLTWHTRTEKRYVEFTEEPVNSVTIANLTKFQGGKF